MTRHIIQISALTITVIVLIFYPFLPGTYDSAASGLSTMAQLFEVVGLLLVPRSIVWMFYEMRKQIRRKKNLPSISRGYRFALSALIIASILLTPISLLILFGVGISFGVLTLALWFFSILRLRPKLRALKETEGDGFNPAPLYLIVIPLIVLVAQILLARPATSSAGIM